MIFEARRTINNEIMKQVRNVDEEKNRARRRKHLDLRLRLQREEGTSVRYWYCGRCDGKVKFLIVVTREGAKIAVHLHFPALYTFPDFLYISRSQSPIKLLNLLSPIGMI